MQVPYLSDHFRQCPSEIMLQVAITCYPPEGVRVIAAEPGAADKVRAGNVNAAGALIGLVMKATSGQADAAKVRSLLLKELGQ